MKNLVLKRIQQMCSYNPPLDGRAAYRGVLLDFNERTIATTGLQRYPEYGDLAEQVGNYVQVPGSSILVTNGSDQGIDLIFRAFVEVGDGVVLPEPSFAMFKQCADIQGACIVRQIKPNTKLIVICNPNNPTGALTPLLTIEALAKTNPNTIILIDEAYAEFSGVTAIPLMTQYPNIIVTRTFSKAFGLASVRMGYIVANSTYIQELKKIMGPYDLNSAGVTAVRVALADTSYVTSYVQEVMQQAKPLVELFFRKNSIEYYPSQANFVLFKPDQAEHVAQRLEQAGYRLRLQRHPSIAGTLRVSIGTVPQMRRFINVYQQVILQRQPQRIALFDRDGTLVYEPESTKQLDDVKDVRLLPGVIPALQGLQAQGYLLVMVSNQDGLGTVAFPQVKFAACQELIIQHCKAAGVTFAEVLICPHLPTADCTCRKPKTGLIDALFCDYAVDYVATFLCGDRPTDRQCADALGITFYPSLTDLPL
ncbi:MAG: histidinol-phosphatase [Candidatus Kerfeldbacteria bacterium]|nr:histidinol-phosphatase [Candidatus Kerfeldbacteria bacterium]